MQKLILTKKKIALLSTLLIWGTTLGSVSFAAPPAAGAGPSNGDNAGIIVAIHEVKNTIESLALSGAKSLNTRLYELDKTLANLIEVNTQKSPINSENQQSMLHHSEEVIKNAFSEFPNSALTYSSSSQPIVKETSTQEQQRHQLIDQLTLGTMASDTIYSAVNNIDASTFYTHYAMGKPAELHDNDFNFTAVVTPDTYTLSQEQSSQQYVLYATQPYQSLLNGLKLDVLKNWLNQYANDPVTLGQKLQQFRDSDSYKNFQLMVRSSMAAKSVAVNTFDELVTERTPIRRKDPDSTLEALSKAMGFTPRIDNIPDPNNPGQTIAMHTYPSPLQIANYMANWRINSQDWYRQIAADAPATLQRKSLEIQAENESQLQSINVAIQKLSAAISMMGIQVSQLNQQIQSQQVQAVNSTIDSLTSSGTTPEQTAAGP